MRRGGSKLLTGILCFLLGFILAFGAIGGAVAAVAFLHPDTLLSFVGVSNKDEEGESIYVNTGEDGVTSVYDLVLKVVEMTSDPQNITVGKFEQLLPVTNQLVNPLVESFVVFLDKDKEQFRSELMNTPVSDMGNYLTSVVYSVRMDTVLTNYAPDLLTNTELEGQVVRALAYGDEAKYVVGTEIPVYYDIYKRMGGTLYQRYVYDDLGQLVADTDADGNSVFWSDTLGLMEEQQQEPLVGYHKLYHYEYDLADTSVWYVTDSNFTLTFDAGNPTDATYVYAYGADGKNNCSGNYYTQAGETVTVDPVTIGDIATNKFDFNKIVNEIGMDNIIRTTPDNAMMSKIVYKNVTAMEKDGDGNWTCVYTDAGGVRRNCTVALDAEGYIVSIDYEVAGEARTVPATKVGEVASVVEDLTLATLLGDVKIDDSIMLYFAYGVHGVEKINDTTYSGVTDLGPCTIKVNASKTVQSIINDADGEPVEGSNINAVAMMAENAMNVLTIGDLLGGEKPTEGILKSLWNTKVGEIDTAIDDLTLGDVVGGTKPVDGILKSLWDKKVGEIDTAIDDLTLGDALGGEGSDNVIIARLWNVKICDIATEMDKITIQELYAQDIYGTATPTLADTYQQGQLYYEKVDDKYVLVGTNGKLESSEFVANTYYTYGAATGIWKLMLCTRQSASLYDEAARKLTDLSKLTVNVTDNLQDATLRELVDSGIIGMNDKTKLDKDFQGAKLGDYTLAVLIDIIPTN